MQAEEVIQDVSPSFPKSCTKCGRIYVSALGGWCDLEYVGIQPVDQTEHLELRNCGCGSTIAVSLPGEAPPYVG